MHRGFLVAGAGSAFIGVALGAFGAHVLRDRLAADMLAVFQTGVQYQVLHALALMLVAVLYGQVGRKDLVGWSGRLFVAGTVVFSGSLYGLALSGVKWLGAI